MKKKCDALPVGDDIFSESKYISSQFSFPGNSLLRFYVGCDPSIFLVFPLMYRPIFRLFSRAATSLETYFEYVK